MLMQSATRSQMSYSSAHMCLGRPRLSIGFRSCCCCCCCFCCCCFCRCGQGVGTGRRFEANKSHTCSELLLSSCCCCCCCCCCVSGAAASDLSSCVFSYFLSLSLSSSVSSCSFVDTDSSRTMEQKGVRNLRSDTLTSLSMKGFSSSSSSV